MKRIVKIFSKDEVDLLKGLIGKKLDFIHHQNEQFFDKTLAKVGLKTENGLFSLDTIYEVDDFLWPNESYAKLCFHKEDNEDGFNVQAMPPLRYVNDKINDYISDILLIIDSVTMVENDVDVSSFTHIKGIVICFKNHQISLYLEDCLMDDLITVCKSTDVLSKINSVEDEWDNGDWSSSLSSYSNRKIISVNDI